MLVTIIWAATWQNQQNDCAPSEDSDQHGHSPSLIRVFAVRMKKPCALNYQLSAPGRLWMPRLIRVFVGRTLILLVLSCRGSFVDTSHTKWRLRAELYVVVRAISIWITESWHIFIDLVRQNNILVFYHSISSCRHSLINMKIQWIGHKL